MGLTGIILRATIAMTRTETAYFIADGGVQTATLDETIAVHSDGSEANYTYSSAWFDAISPEPKLGRASISRGRLATFDELPAKLKQNPLGGFNAPTLVTLPDIFPEGGLANKFTFSAIGEVYYRMGGNYTGKVQNLSQFYHMLDLFGGEWNRAYGRTGGFVQYQTVVPPRCRGAVQGCDPGDPGLGTLFLPECVQALRRRQSRPAQLPDGGLERLRGLPDQAGGAGRVLQRTRPPDHGVRRPGLQRQGLPVSAANFHQMYPRIDEFLAVRRRIDPHAVFASDMARRLELI